MTTRFQKPYWNSVPRPRYSQYGPNVREVPVRHVRNSSEKKPDRSSSAAVKIQKLFRGFRVRKSVKKIFEIGREVSTIENSFSREETIRLILKDSKERLRVNEMLMTLLLKLDSVRGVDSGVRDFRKTVIKKAIALQEFLDTLVSNNNNNNDDDDDDDDDSEATMMDCQDYVVENHDSSVLEKKIEEEEVKNQNGKEDDWEVIGKQDVLLQSMSASEYPEEEEESMGTSQADSSENLQEPIKDDGVSSSKPETNQQKELNVKEKENLTRERRDKTNRELLERMMEDNEKMMGLMTQLYERNDIQTRLLSTLSLRVEQLERAFVCEKLRRKKKRHANATVDGCESSPPNGKKTGKR